MAKAGATTSDSNVGGSESGDSTAQSSTTVLAMPEVTEMSRKDVAEMSRNEVPEMSRNEVSGMSRNEVTEMIKSEVTEASKSEVVETGSATKVDVQLHEQQQEAQSGAEAGSFLDEESSREIVRENGEKEVTSGRDDIVHATGESLQKSPEKLAFATEVDSIEENHVNGVHHEAHDRNENVALEESTTDPELATSPLGMAAPETMTTPLSQPKPVVVESQQPDAPVQEDDPLDKERKMMEAALLGAARQSQVSFWSGFHSAWSSIEVEYFRLLKSMGTCALFTFWFYTAGRLGFSNLSQCYCSGCIDVRPKSFLVFGRQKLTRFLDSCWRMMN